jgi:hypothetical protein
MYRDAIRAALSWTLRDLELYPTAVVLRGQAYPREAGDPLLTWRAAIQRLLYEVCYTRRLSEAGFDRRLAAGTQEPDAGLRESLRAISASSAHWDGGWLPVGPPEPGGRFIMKGDALRWAPAGECLVASSGGAPGRCWLLVRHDARELMPGFHFLFGRTPGDAADEFRPVRFYLHSRASTAAAVGATIADLLDAFGVPFRYKTLDFAAGYDRTDPSVLYVAARHAVMVERLLRHAFSETPGRWLDASVPLFTRRVADGIGFAVDPGNGESFGTDRCRIVAEGILDAWRAGEASEAGRWAAVEDRFAALGVSLDRPYLGAGQAAWIA